jgi:3-deoxy-D-manno-octulosonic acid kinase
MIAQTVSDVQPPEVAPFIPVVRGPYEFGSREKLADDLANRLVGVMKERVELAPRGVLGGRTYSASHDLPGLGRIFLKHYAHGGLLRAFTAQLFLAVGPSRSQEEFEMLELVRSLGVRAPRPLVYVKRGTFFYATWLLMEELQGVRSLVEVSAEKPDDLKEIMKSVGDQLAILIKNRVLHIDLHPGNVLVDSAGLVYIVDFDKARMFGGSPFELRDLYLRRWRRAVIKHGLSPMLTELMSLSLRSYHE